MAAEKFSLLRTILRTIGLSDEAIEDIIDRIAAFLSPKSDKAELEFPYALRDDFLSAAELSFCMVLRTVVAERLLICPKVALADLFFAKTGDHRQNRIFLNRIDRKHVDFLLCEPKTLRPVVGIELDDKSHQRPDRRERDEFVDGVFVAAKLPLIRVPARRGYAAAELHSALNQYFVEQSPAVETSPGVLITEPVAVMPAPTKPGDPAKVEQQAAPRCPKCSSEMVLRTARTGAKQGGKFWGCSNFPRCRGISHISEERGSSFERNG
jgi:hypothetical protein